MFLLSTLTCIRPSASVGHEVEYLHKQFIRSLPSTFLLST